MHLPQRERALDAQSDARLVEAVRARDAHAFEALYRRHAAAVLAVAYRTTRDRRAADDAVQSAFTRLWERADTIQTENVRLRAWLITVSRNAAIDAMRRTAKMASSFEHFEEPPAPERAEDRIMEDQRRQAIGQALGALPDEQRDVIELAFFGGLTQAEIATVLDTPLGTIKGRVRLAMQKLRATLEPIAESI